MARLALVVCFLGLALGAFAEKKGDWSSASSSTSPVQKVIELLSSLKGKLADDLKKEEGLMAEFSDFCDDELKEVAYSIETAGAQIQDFEAAMEDAKAQISNMATEISAGSSAIAAKETEIAEAAKVRDAQNKDFQDNEHELSLTIDELARSLVAAKKDLSFLQTKASLAEQKPNNEALVSALSKLIEATTISQKSKDKLQGFLQETENAEEGEDLRLGAPVQGTVHEYEGHSGGILDTLTDMEEKAQGQLSDLRKAEMEAQFTYQMVKQGLEDEVKLLKTRLSDNTAAKAANAEALGKAKGELAYTTKTKQADEARLQGQTTECESKTAEWARRQKEAVEEMAVIDKAKEILAGGVKSFFQAKTAVQMATKATKIVNDDDEDKEEELRDRLAETFKGLSKKFGSYALAQMVSSARADPFGKIRGLINDMIEKLMNAANEEANAKAFCDEETAKARKSQADKSALYDKFTARLDEAASKKEILKNAVAELQKELAAIDAQTAVATKIRSEEHAENLKASKDFKDSADAVVAAVSVLKSYYEGSFIQLKSERQPAALGVSEGPGFGGYGKTEGDSAHTIIEVLQIAEEDFTKLLAETEAEEEAAAAEFKRASDQSKVAKATKTQEAKDKTSEIKSLTVALTHHGEDRATVSKELDAVLSYLDKLKPQCESKEMSYAEKKARREAEIEGLKDAMAILEGTGVAVELAQKKTNLRQIRKI